MISAVFLSNAAEERRQLRYRISQSRSIRPT